MINYKCAHCGVELETDDALGGKEEPCPECGKVNAVPLSKQLLAWQKNEQRQRALREKERLRQEQEERIKANEAQLQKDWDDLAKKEAMRVAKNPELSPERPCLLFVLGIVLILAGAIVTFGFMCMDVSAGYGANEIANLDKMFQRLGGIVLGAGLFVGGILFVGQGVVVDRLWITSKKLFQKDSDGSKPQGKS